MKTLIMLSAIPASGKSTWAREYAKNHPHTYIISSDEIRMELCGGVFGDQSKQAQVWKVFDERIHEYAKKHDDVTVILDALNDVNEVRLKYLKTTPEFDKKVLVLFPTASLEKSQALNSKRKKEMQVPREVLIQLANKFEQPSDEVLDLVDQVIRVVWEN